MASNSLAILNAIRDSASTEYQERIPVATRDNLQQIGVLLETYEVAMNEFVSTLITKIALTVFSEKMAKNKLARFKSGEVVSGGDVEDIFVEMVSSVVFDPEGTNPLGRRKPDNVHVLFHRENYKATYEVTVSDEQVKSAFRTESGVHRLTQALINAMYSGANHDEYINMKELLAMYKTTDGSAYRYFDYEVKPVTDEASARDMIKTVRKAVSDLTYVSNKFNGAGVKTFSEKENLVLLVNKDVLAHTDVDVLAKAFNMGKTDFEPTIVEVDNFGSMADTYAILCDEDFYKVYDTLRRIESQRNAKGMFTNYFLHIWQIQSLSLFKNAVRFKKVAGA